MVLAPLPRLLAAGLAMVAVIPVLFAFVAPWGGYEVDGTFSSSGCSGSVADADYYLRHSTRAVRTASDGVDCPTTVYLEYGDVAADESAITRSRNPGMTDLAQAYPMVLTGALLGVVATGSIGAGLMRTRLPALLGGALAVLAAVGLIAGAVFFQVGAGAQMEWETTAPQGDLRSDPSAWSWGGGLWATYAASLLWLGGGIAAFLPARFPAASEPEEGAAAKQARDDGDAESTDSEGAPTPTVAADTPAGASEPAAETIALPEGTDAEGRPPRRLKCPKCEHRFLGEWGKPPTCPSCGHGPRRKPDPRPAAP